MRPRLIISTILITLTLLGLWFVYQSSLSNSTTPKPTSSSPEASLLAPAENSNQKATSLPATDQWFEVNNRKYFVHIPPNYDKQKLYPLVLNFHGGSGSPEGHAIMTKMNEVADRENFIVAYPRGTRPDGKELRPLLRFWNPGTGPDGQQFHNSNELLAGVNDIEYISSLLDHISSQLSIDQEKIFAVGFSNGGMVAQKAACELSNKFSGVATVSGPFWHNPNDCQLAKPLPVIIFYGTADPCVPYNGGPSECEAGLGGSRRTFIGAKATESIWAEKNGCTEVSKIAKIKGDTTCTSWNCPANAAVTLCTVDQGGHTWPGSTPNSLPGLDVGKTTQDINASEIIWEFFQNKL